MKRKLMDFSTYKKIKALSFNDLNRWVTTVYGCGYEDGRESADSECVSALSDDRLMEILLSVKGIGEKRAKQAVELILKEGVTYGSET